MGVGPPALQGGKLGKVLLSERTLASDMPLILGSTSILHIPKYGIVPYHTTLAYVIGILANELAILSNIGDID